jgi:hypothetical protein
VFRAVSPNVIFLGNGLAVDGVDQRVHGLRGGLIKD